MSEIITWTLAAATILGGIAAISYFYDKYQKLQQWSEESKEVNTVWWESSELKKEYEEKGCKNFAWSNADRVEQRVAEGKAIVYEFDEQDHVKYRLVNKSGQVLICQIDD
jgi:hypothetical protein